jgi:hypothetical protein
VVAKEAAGVEVDWAAAARVAAARAAAWVAEVAREEEVAWAVRVVAVREVEVGHKCMSDCLRAERRSLVPKRTHRIANPLWIPESSHSQTAPAQSTP